MASVNTSQPSARQTAFDTGIWYSISLWPALSVAVQNNWGGPMSAEKRDWFAGAISDLFAERPDTDALDLETVLLQVMQDEFDVNVEDESEIPVAAEIMALKRSVLEDGDIGAVDAVRQRFERRKGKVEKVNVVENKNGDEDSSEDDEEEDDDVEMGEAPQLAPTREKAEPEIDEDGFTKVVSKKKR